jgi:hypothetical protein
VVCGYIRPEASFSSLQVATGKVTNSTCTWGLPLVAASMKAVCGLGAGFCCSLSAMGCQFCV